LCRGARRGGLRPSSAPYCTIREFCFASCAKSKKNWLGESQEIVAFSGGDVALRQESQQLCHRPRHTAAILRGRVLRSLSRLPLSAPSNHALTTAVRVYWRPVWSYSSVALN